MFRYSAIVQLFHPTTILCDTISLYLNTYFSRNFLHYHPFRQGFEPFCICCTHKSKRNVKPTLSNALTIIGWDCVHLHPHYIRFPGKDVIACLTAFAGLHGITQARVCRLAVSSLESVCPPLDSRGKHSRHSLVPHIIFTLRISRNAQPHVATPSACNTCYTPWRMKTGDGEGARVCVFRCNREFI